MPRAGDRATRTGPRYGIADLDALVKLAYLARMNVHSATAPDLKTGPGQGVDTESRPLAILDSAKRVFAEKGFDGASMQDIARAAGMSAGNFYRYFSSKNALVEAMVERDLAGVEQEFAAILGSADPLGALRATVVRRLDEGTCKEGPLWTEIAAAAARRPEIAQVLHQMESEIVRYLTAVFARITGLGRTEAERRFSAQAAYLVILVKGAAMQMNACCLSLTPQAQTGLRGLILRSIDDILRDVAAPAADRSSPIHSEVTS